ncbi:7785_t:CDS:2, partial [Cetraspora pellucida]
NNQKVGLQVAREIALNKNRESPLRYVKSIGRWCKICSKEKQKNIDPKYKLSNLLTAIKIAHTHRSKYFSSSYVDNLSSFLWECSEEHRWITLLANIKNRDT